MKGLYNIHFYLNIVENTLLQLCRCERYLKSLSSFFPINMRHVCNVFLSLRVGSFPTPHLFYKLCVCARACMHHSFMKYNLRTIKFRHFMNKFEFLWNSHSCAVITTTIQFTYFYLKIAQVHIELLCEEESENQ